MGMNFFGSRSCSADDKSIGGFSSSKSDIVYSNTNILANLPNPNPSNYLVLRAAQVTQYVIMEIKYLDCTNYEGKKILVFRCALNQLLSQRNIDPHFSNNSKFISPIARFEPTDTGWMHANVFVDSIK